MNKNLLLEFQDKNVGKLYIYCEDGKACLMIDNYDFDHNHRITRRSELFIPMKKMLDDIRKNDVMRNFHFNRFEWISEGNGMPEARNRLVIYELENIIIMNFIKSKYNNDKQDTCLIQFDLNDSKNKPIVNMFNDLFAGLYNRPKMRDLRKGSLLK